MTEEVKNWAAELAAKRRAKDERADVERRKVLSDRDLAQRNLPRLWRELDAAVAQCMAALDAELPGVVRLERSRGQRIGFISVSTGREVGVLVIPPLDLRVCTTYGEYKLEVVGLDDFRWVDAKFGEVSTAQSIAEVAVARAFEAA